VYGIMQDRGGDLSENLGVLGNVGIWDCGAGARSAAVRGRRPSGGRVREGVAPPAKGVGDVTPENFLNYTWPQMRFSAFWIHKFQKITV
jgi:hypothetical protein